MEENLRYINEMEVLTHINLIFNHPGDSEDICQETLNFFKKVFSKSRKISVDFHPNEFLYYPGTYIFENIEYFEKEYGTVIRHKTWWKEHGWHIKLASDIIPSRDAPGRVRWQPKMIPFFKSSIEEKFSRNAMLSRLWFSNVCESQELVSV